MAVYRPIGFSPNNTTIDMLEIQVFTAIMQSTTTDYALKIFKISDNTVLYDSGKVNLTVALYATEQLNITVPITPSIGTVRDLKYTITVWNLQETVTSREIPFKNYEMPTLSVTVPNTINEQSYEFIGVQSQPQGIIVERFKYELYDNNFNKISSSGYIYNSSLRYTFSNFLDNTQYKITCETYDINGIYTKSQTYNFLVDYESPSVLFKPLVENIKNTSAIRLSWAGAYSLEGVSTGTISYIDDFIYLGNTGIDIETSSNVKWDSVNILEDNTVSFLFKPKSTGFSGNILNLSNTTDGISLNIGFNGSAFYKEQNGIYQYSINFSLSTSIVYLIVIYDDKLIIKEMQSET